MASKEVVRAIERSEERRHDDYAFVETPPPVSVFCVFCKLLLIRPLQAECGDRMCEDCYKKIRTEEEDPKCSKCRIDLKDGKLWRDVFAEKELAELEIFCDRKKDGCEWRGQLALFQGHLSNCLWGREGKVQISGKNRAKELRNLSSNTRDVEKCHSVGLEKAVDGLSIRAEMQQEHLESNCNAQAREERRAEKTKLETTPHLVAASEGVHAASQDLDRLRESVSESRRDFRILQQSNTKAVEALTERIANLETQATDMQAHQRLVQTKILEACYQSVDNAQRDYRAKFDNVESHLRIMTEKMLKMEETITTQAARIRSLEDENNSLRTNAPSLSTSGMGTGSSLSPLIEQQFSQQDRILASHDIKLAEHGLRIDMLDCKNTEGVLLWKITEIRRRRREAVSGKTPSIYSQPFYTSGCGYKLCARLYLNGDGMGKGTHLSLFFVVMRGEYDALLPWPFQQKVTLVLMDQTYGRHVSDTFRPDPTSSSFKKPRNEMNIASGCPLFVPLSTLDGGDYIRDDTLFIKVVVDTSDVTRPDKR
ncbi:TNF receptor-associated factor 3-like [Oscarella lobularis]|uniref:TNF receptor-associated factor 3-like n=1 Tax=Oscarella lobularis TaxID=121494 RepID=UPI003313FA4A